MLVNLTPHELNVRRMDGSFLTLPPSGEVARVVEKRDGAALNHYPESVQDVALHDGIFISTVAYSSPDGLPDPELDKVYVVSAMVRQAVPYRLDVLSPGELIRNESGQPIGCDGLVANTTL